MEPKAMNHRYDSMCRLKGILENNGGKWIIGHCQRDPSVFKSRFERLLNVEIEIKHMKDNLYNIRLVEK